MEHAYEFEKKSPKFPGYANADFYEFVEEDFNSMKNMLSANSKRPSQWGKRLKVEKKNFEPSILRKKIEKKNLK